MKLKSIFLNVFWTILILSIQSCYTNEVAILNDPNNQNNQSNASIEAPNDPNKSRIQIKLVDSPDENYQQVWVDIIDFQYNRNDDASGWISFEGFPINSGEKMVDLTELIAGTSHVLADEDIEPGMLSKVRIVLGDKNYLILEGNAEEHVPLKTPSAQQSGLKLHVETNLEAGFSYTFVLDWDVQKSIVKAGNSGNYNLKPVIRAHTEINAGNIIGTIAEKIDVDDIPLEGAVVSVFDINNPLISVASTLTNSNGDFELAILPIGSYTLKITYNSAEYEYDVAVYPEDTSSITVIKDTTEDVGIIYMMKSMGSLFGRVADILEDEINPMPIGGATVTIYAADDDDFSDIIETTTSSNEENETKGDFNFPELLPGEYILKVVMASYDDGQSESIEVFIHIENNAGTIFLTKSMGSISGRVADATETESDLKPLGGAIVRAYAKDDTAFSTSLGEATTSNAEDETKGTFEIPNLILGEYILKVTLENYNEGQSGIIGIITSGEIHDVGTLNLTLTPIP